MEPWEKELPSQVTKKADGMQFQRQQEKIKSRRQDKTVLQKGWNNVKLPAAQCINVSSTIHELWKALLKSNQETQFLDWQNYLAILLYFFDYPIEVVRLSTVFNLLQISHLCLFHSFFY